MIRGGLIVALVLPLGVVACGDPAVSDCWAGGQPVPCSAWYEGWSAQPVEICATDAEPDAGDACTACIRGTCCGVHAGEPCDCAEACR